MITLDAMLLRAAVQVALFSIALAGVYYAARWLGARAAAATLLWGMTLMLGLTLLVGSPWPRWDVAALLKEPSAQPQPARTAPAEEPPAPTGAPLEPVVVAADLPTFTLADYAREFTAALTEPAAANQAESSRWSWLLLAAIAGAAVSLVRLAIGLMSVRRLTRGSKPIANGELETLLDRLREELALGAPVALRESADLSTPATVGWRRPAVLLPTTWRDWSADERRAVLAHELAHIAGRDYLGWVVARLAVAVHFYNPLVRWLAARLQLEQELAADAAAAQVVGDRQRYLHTLAALALATPPRRVAGPARTLFPTRSLLMRRVEMLRSPLYTLKNRPAAGLKWTAGLLLALIAVGVAGLRPPTSVAEEPTTYDVIDFNAVEPIPLTLVPEGSNLVVAVKPSLMLSRAEFAPLSGWLDRTVKPISTLNLNVSDIAELLIAGRVPTPAMPGTEWPRMVVRLRSEKLCNQWIANFSKAPGMKQMANTKRPTWGSKSAQLVQIDDATLLFDNTPTPEQASAPAWADSWGDRSRSVNVYFNNRQLLADIGDQDVRQLEGGQMIQFIAPIVGKIDHVFGSLTVDEKARVEINAAADNAEDAQQIAATLGALRVLAQNALADQRDAAAGTPANNPALRPLLDLLDQALTGAKIATEGESVRISYEPEQSVEAIAGLLNTLLPAVEAARTSARRTQSTNNLKHLALAMLNFNDVHQRLPQASSHDYYDYSAEQWKKSEHPHSWRVTLLPFLEQQALYNAYNFDEPWDSEANMKIANTLVPVMVDPSSTSETNTSYFLPVGPSTAFPADRGIGFRDIPDGTSKTLMIIEAKRDIPWTKPEDLPVGDAGPLPEFGGHYENIFLAARCDGSVSVFSEDIATEEVRGMLLRDDAYKASKTGAAVGGLGDGVEVYEPEPVGGGLEVITPGDNDQ